MSDDAASGENVNREAAGARALAAAPRAGWLVLAPLGVIALGFIAPPIIPGWLWPRVAQLHLISPFEDGASWMWSIQIGALVLSLITLVNAKRRSEPDLGARIIATLATLAVLHLAAVMLYVLRGEAPALTITSAVVVAGAVGGLVQAFRVRGWGGWLWALGAYAIAAVPYACPLWPGMFNEFSGGLTFIVADATLLALVAMGLRHQQRR